MSKFLITLCLTAALCPGQWKEPGEAEQNDLRQALGEAGSSPIEFLRALEKHLVKYPASPQRAQIERALVKAAIEARDDRRLLTYGEKVIARGEEDPQILERVARVLLKTEDPQAAERALKYARKFEEIMRALDKEPTEARRGQMTEELDRAIGKALVFQARATGNLGKTAEAIALATKSYERSPSAEAAREIGRWLARSGRELEAVDRYAEAFTIADSRATADERARDRAKMGELYSKVKKTEEGLGDVVLRAYDRTAELMARRAVLQREQDPNSRASDVLEFTLNGLQGDKLPLASLKGKVVVMDFWATWCGPCRVQHPLYEKVKAKFGGNESVVFLSVNTDEDQSSVQPFVTSQKWSHKVYFEGGLSEFLRVSSIPTTVILDQEGRVVNRMNGFLPERFVDMLTERISEVLANPATTASAPAPPR